MIAEKSKTNVFLDPLKNKFQYNLISTKLLWPAVINESHREEYLTGEEFIRIFKYQKNIFSGLSKERQTELKNNVNLI